MKKRITFTATIAFEFTLEQFEEFCRDHKCRPPSQGGTLANLPNAIECDFRGAASIMAGIDHAVITTDTRIHEDH